MDIMSQRIYNKRKELDLTMEELARKIGVTKSTISKWEKGNIENIKSSNIAALSDALGVTPIWLMGMDEPIISIGSGYTLPKETKERMKKNHREHLIEQIENLVLDLEYIELERLAAFVEYRKTVKKNEQKSLL